jgi:hypothetical protein
VSGRGPWARGVTVCDSSVPDPAYSEFFEFFRLRFAPFPGAKSPKSTGEGGGDGSVVGVAFGEGLRAGRVVPNSESTKYMSISPLFFAAIFPR